MYATGYEQLTVAASAVSPTAAPSENANRVLVKVTGNAVRFRMDGTAPTAAVGWPLAVGDTMELGCSPSTLQFISQSGTAVLEMLYLV